MVQRSLSRSAHAVLAALTLVLGACANPPSALERGQEYAEVLATLDASDASVDELRRLSERRVPEMARRAASLEVPDHEQSVLQALAWRAYLRDALDPLRLASSWEESKITSTSDGSCRLPASQFDRLERAFRAAMEASEGLDLVAGDRLAIVQRRELEDYLGTVLGFDDATTRRAIEILEESPVVRSRLALVFEPDASLERLERAIENEVGWRIPGSIPSHLDTWRQVFLRSAAPLGLDAHIGQFLDHAFHRASLDAIPVGDIARHEHHTMMGLLALSFGVAVVERSDPRSRPTQLVRVGDDAVADIAEWINGSAYFDLDERRDIGASLEVDGTEAWWQSTVSSEAAYRGATLP